MAKFTSDSSAMSSIAGKLSAASSEYQSISKQLVQTAHSTTETYSSADNTTFIQKIDGCAVALQAMADKLQVAADMLKKQAANYDTTEEHNTTQAKSLGN